MNDKTLEMLDALAAKECPAGNGTHDWYRDPTTAEFACNDCDVCVSDKVIAMGTLVVNVAVSIPAQMQLDWQQGGNTRTFAYRQLREMCRDAARDLLNHAMQGLNNPQAIAAFVTPEKFIEAHMPGDPVSEEMVGRVLEQFGYIDPYQDRRPAREIRFDRDVQPSTRAIMGQSGGQLIVDEDGSVRVLREVVDKLAEVGLVSDEFKQTADQQLREDR